MFSVLTPTYNRADRLHRVYDSLKCQVFKDFEWIIVDDAGTDSTEMVVSQWQKDEKEFNIIYFKLPENLGKAGVINFGSDQCNHKIMLIADDDDTFAPKTLDDLRVIWEAIDRTEDGWKIGAVWTLVQDERGQLIGEPFPANFWQVDFKARVLDRNGPPVGEKWHSWRTSVLKKYKKFTNPNSRVSPSVSWNRINKDYDFLCVNVVHRTYYYSEDGLINQKKSRLKVEKRHYYSAFFELEKIPPLTILKEPYYRTVAFKYIKSLYFYRDKEVFLKGSRLMSCILAFCVVFPKKILFRVQS